MDWVLNSNRVIKDKGLEIDLVGYNKHLKNKLEEKMLS